MPNELKGLSELSKQFKLGQNVAKRVIETKETLNPASGTYTREIIVRPHLDPIDQASLDQVNVAWAKSEAVIRTAMIAKEIKDIKGRIQQEPALLNQLKETQKELARTRERIEQELLAAGGLVGAVNSNKPVNKAKTQSDKKALLIFALGQAHQAITGIAEDAVYPPPKPDKYKEPDISPSLLKPIPPPKLKYK